jgi:hypothetical protein
MPFGENRTFLNSFPKSWERLFRPGQNRPSLADTSAGTEGGNQGHRRRVEVIEPVLRFLQISAKVAASGIAKTADTLPSAQEVRDIPILRTQNLAELRELCAAMPR